MRWAALTLTVLFGSATLRAEPAASPSTSASARVAASSAGVVPFGPPAASANVERDAAVNTDAKADAPLASGALAPAAPPADARASEPGAVAKPSASAMPKAIASAAAGEQIQQHAPAPTPSAAPASSAEAAKVAPVRLADSVVFSLRLPRAGKSAQERARLASKALQSAVDDPRASDVKSVRQGDIALIYAGPTLIVQLNEADAKAAGDTSLDVHAGVVVSAVHQALESERQRSRIAKNVFSLSLMVFFALIAFYVARKLGEVVERLRSWLEENGDRVLAIRVQRIELVTPEVLKSSALVAVGVAKWLGQFGVFYAWLVIVLSLFESTRDYTQKLTGFVLTPLSQLMTRVATTLPVVVVASLAALSVLVLVRFVGLFFAGVARRETALAWLPPDLAAPTSVLLRVAIVLAALVFAAPVVTGDNDGALGRAGAIALIACGLSATPLLATGMVGIVVLFGRRLRVGEHVELEGKLGRILAINLLELRLETSDRSELRVPHLLLLRRPLRGLGRRPRLTCEIAVNAEAAPGRVLPLLDDAANRIGRDVRSELVRADADGLVYRVSAACDSLDARSLLTTELVEALARAGIALGRAKGTSP